MNSKCYIMTFNNTNNYGAFWQAFALQELVKDYIETYHVFYEKGAYAKYDSFKGRLKYLNPIRFFKKLKEVLKGQQSSLVQHQDPSLLLERIKMYDVARKKFLFFTEPFSARTIKNIPQKDAKFIVGSDQMWNYSFFTKSDLKMFLLQFVKNSNKKNSYAVSFGFYDVPKEYEKLYAKNIRSFNKISVRENRGAELVKELTGRDAKLVLDPTLLLNKSQWNEKVQFDDNNEKYILMYSMRKDEYHKLYETAEEISKKTGCKIYTIENFASNYSINPINASPEEFLNKLYNAEYIITDSFHASIFSINFNKKFFVRTFDGENAAKMNTRIDSITQLLELEDRVLNGNNDLLAEIDYDRVNKILEEKRVESLDFLKSILVEE